MPIGVPKVPFFPEDSDSDDNEKKEYEKEKENKEYEKEKDLEGEVEVEETKEEEVEYVDLFDIILYEQRLIFLSGEITQELALKITGLLVYLSLKDPTREINLFINSPGGLIEAGLSIYDTMQFVDAPVYTTCIGKADSIAALILAGGEINHRSAFPHARIMLKQPEIFNMTQTTGAFLFNSDLVSHYRRLICDGFQTRTGQHYGVIWEDMENVRRMSAKEAKSYGIIDFIVQSTKD